MDLSLRSDPLDLSRRLESERERLLREGEPDLPRREKPLGLSEWDDDLDLCGHMLVFDFSLESDLDLPRLPGVRDFRLGLTGDIDLLLLVIGVLDLSLSRGEDPDLRLRGGVLDFILDLGDDPDRRRRRGGVLDLIRGLGDDPDLRCLGGVRDFIRGLGEDPDLRRLEGVLDFILDRKGEPDLPRFGGVLDFALDLGGDFDVLHLGGVLDFTGLCGDTERLTDFSFRSGEDSELLSLEWLPGFSLIPAYNPDRLL